VLARDDRGNPAILEATIGSGRAVVSMADIETEYLDGKPGGAVFENAVALLSRAGSPIGYVAAEDFGLRAFRKLGVPVETVRNASDLRRFRAVFVDKSTGPLLERLWPELVRWMREGGTLVKLCLQDDRWRPGTFDTTAPQAPIRHDVAVVALPDGRTLFRVDRRVALRDLDVTGAEGLRWHVANDIFNGNRRTFTWGGGGELLLGVTPGASRRPIAVPGPWVAVDDKLALVRVAGSGAFGIVDYPNRRFGLPNSLAAEDVVFPHETERRHVRAGAVVHQDALVITDGGQESGQAWSAPGRARARFSDSGFAGWLRGADGHTYVVYGVWAPAADMGSRSTEVAPDLGRVVPCDLGPGGVDPEHLGVRVFRVAEERERR
jgi:hypothetical protein